MAELVSPEVLRATVFLVSPLLLAAFGEMISERAGVLNLAIEGQMTLAAAVSFVVVFTLGPGLWSTAAALGAAVLAGILVALVLAVLTLTVRADQISVGLALLVFALGAGALLYRAVVGIQLSPPRIATLQSVSVPLLGDIPVLGRILFQHSWYVYMALLAVIPVSWFMLSTRAGLLLRATGENPRSVDSLGLPLQRIRYGAVLGSGALIGIAGAYFPLALAGGFTAGVIGGRGWLAIMLVILGRWQPWMIFAGAFLFGYLDSLQFQLAVTRHAIPTQFLQMLPYVIAIIVIAVLYRRAQFPAWLTRTYQRESRL